MITEFLLFALIAEKEAAMATGRIKDGKLEIDPPKKKLPPHVKAIKAKKRTWKPAR